MPTKPTITAEAKRLAEDASRKQNWKRWGPYLAERQWAVVREDYSPDGEAWRHFPHDHARSRAYRWGEDGLLGITDRECRICFALALWNGRDLILKERLFGLTGPEGNHGEDVKEEYFYLEATPTASYLKALYKYPQAEFPYGRLVAENRSRGRDAPEFELIDTGIFEGNRYFDVFAEYAKRSPDDILVRITVANRGPEASELHVLPTLWFRNTWIWGCTHEGCSLKPRIAREGKDGLLLSHDTLGRFLCEIGPDPTGQIPPVLFTDNETNLARLFGGENDGPFVKDGFHDYLIHGRSDAVNVKGWGTKAAPHYRLRLASGETQTIRLRLHAETQGPSRLNTKLFDAAFATRIEEANDFYDSILPSEMALAERNVARQGYAGLIWSKQFYHFVVADWLAGDPHSPPPPATRKHGEHHA